MNPPLLVLAGPTAVGKSEIAVAVAERCGGEIVGADAFQIYAGLDVLTAKPSTELRARVPHHLVGTVPLTRASDVAQYAARAREAIADIRARRRVPILCGGTGLYLRAVTHGLAELPPADAALRAALEALPLAELQRQLEELDPIGAAQIDRQNPRRVIRAVEVCRLTGRPFSSFREQWQQTPEGVRGVCLTREKEALQARIDARTGAMFAEGVVEEVRMAGEVGPTASQTLGLREIRALLAGEMTPAECHAAIALRTRQYAKRQGTWFRREPLLQPLPLTDARGADDVAAEIAALLRPET